MFLWLFVLQAALAQPANESCDSSFVALPRRRRQCLAADWKFPDFQELYTSGGFREAWGSAQELEQWYREHFACKRSSLLQESVQFDVPSWSNVAASMKNVNWKGIEWGKDVPIDLTKKENNFAYGGLLVNGLLTTVAFADTGGTDWQDYVKGIGSLVGSALELMPGVGPILSVAVAFGLSFFQSSQDDVMEELYKQIMSEVKVLIREQEVKDAVSAAKGQLAGFMQMLSAMPMDFMVDSSNPVPKEQQWYSVLQRYITVMDASEYTIFGNEANCTRPMSVPMRPWSVWEASEDCLDFWASGAFIYQLQYVMIHLNIMAQMAAFGTPNQTAAVLSALRAKAKTYFSLLQASFDGLYKGIPPAGKCQWLAKYHYFEEGFAGGELADPMWNGQSVPCRTGCIDQVQDDFYLHWTDQHTEFQLKGYEFEISCDDTPDSITGKWVKPGTLGQESVTFQMCSQQSFHILRAMVKIETNATFEPMLDSLLNISLQKYNSSAIMAWLNSNPPGPSDPAVNSTVTDEFCKPVCEYLNNNACYNTTVCRLAKDIHNYLDCETACTGAMEAFTNFDKTRCNCKSIVCPAFNKALVDKVNNLGKQTFEDGYTPDSTIVKAWQHSLQKTTGHQGQCEIECNRLFPISTVGPSWLHW